MNTLLEETQTLLERPGVNVTHAAKHIGVSARWIWLLKAGKLTDPGVNKIQRLHDYLASKAA